MINLAIIDSRPNIYKVGIWKELAKSKKIKSHVYFLSDAGIKNEFFDKDFNSYRKSDAWFLNDFTFSFPRNYSIFSNQFFMFITPRISLDILMRKHDVILVHGYNYFMYLFSMLLAKISGVKVIFRGEAVLRGNENENSVKNFVKKYYIKFIFKLSDVVMYSCSGNRQYFEHYNVDISKLYPLPCAVDNKYYSSEYTKFHPKTESIKNELSINKNDFIIIFLARFTKRKRALDLLDAISKIDHSDITILFVGDGPELENMKDFSSKNNIKTIYTGFKEQREISKYYTISDLCVIVSDYDPSPKVMNEAMNFKTPVIVTSVIGTAYDLVEDDHNGFILKLGDIDSLSKKIDYLNKNRDIKNKMSENSLAVINKWNYEKDVYWIERVVEIIK
jgi:glycosyltransferase involved in cell wall biosynthesis